MVEVTTLKIWVLEGRKLSSNGARGISIIISKLQAKTGFAKTAVGYANRSL